MIVTRLDPTDGVSEQFPTRMATFLFSGRKSWDFLQGSSIVASESLQACYEARKRVGVNGALFLAARRGSIGCVTAARSAASCLNAKSTGCVDLRLKCGSTPDDEW